MEISFPHNALSLLIEKENNSLLLTDVKMGFSIFFRTAIIVTSKIVNE